MHLGPNQLLLLYVCTLLTGQQQQSVHASVFPAVVPRQVDTVQFFSGSATKLKFTALLQQPRACGRALALFDKSAVHPNSVSSNNVMQLFVDVKAPPSPPTRTPVYPYTLPSSLHAPSFLSATATWHSFSSGSMLR